MRNGGLERSGQGSAVIETILCLTIFVVAILTILSFINMCRAQAMIAEAVDATAKEMSQYAYFYHVSGLEKLERDIYSSTAEDRKKLSNIVESVDGVYAAFDKAGTEIGEMGDSIKTAIEGGGASGGIDGIVTAAVGVAEGAEVVMEGLADKIDSLSDALSAVDNPLAFAKSLLKVACMKGSSIVKSRLIAAPLAKALIKKHLSQDGMSADEFLEKYHIDGMNALNFNMSTIFDPESPDDIHLVLYYKMKAVKFFNFEIGEVTLHKEAVTRAWLGGDQ